MCSKHIMTITLIRQHQHRQWLVAWQQNPINYLIKYWLNINARSWVAFILRTISLETLKLLGAHEIDGLAQERRNFIANALELCLSCANPLKWSCAASLTILVKCKFFYPRMVCHPSHDSLCWLATNLEGHTGEVLSKVTGYLWTVGGTENQQQSTSVWWNIVINVWHIFDNIHWLHIDFR